MTQSCWQLAGMFATCPEDQRWSGSIKPDPDKLAVESCMPWMALLGTTVEHMPILPLMDSADMHVDQAGADTCI